MAVFTAISSGDVAALIKPLTDVISGADVTVQRNAEHWFGNQGTVGNLSAHVDEVLIWFRAWSEDDFDPSPTAKVDPANPAIRDLGERRYERGDDKWYERGFSFPLRSVPVGKYVISGAAKDDGWYYDVAVVSTLVVDIIPDPKAAPGFQPIATFAPSVRSAPKRLDPRPFVDSTTLEAARGLPSPSGRVQPTP